MFNMFHIIKNIKIVTVDKGEVKKLASTFRAAAIQATIAVLVSFCIVGYVLSNYCVITWKEDITQMEIEQLNEYMDQDQAILVYNYIKENGLKRYIDLEKDINGIGLKTVQKLEKYTFIDKVHWLF